MSIQLYQIVCNFGDAGLTSDGGFYVIYTNRTGSASVKGTLAIASTNYDNAVDIAPANSDMPIGVIYQSNIGNGSPVMVVVGGRAQVLLQDAVGSTRGYWCGMSPTSGRMYQSATVPSTTEHFREIGHSLQTVSGGTN